MDKEAIKLLESIVYASKQRLLTVTNEEYDKVIDDIEEFLISMPEYCIRLAIDPERKLYSVSHTLVSYNIGEGYATFKTIDEAQALMDMYTNWSWSGVAIVIDVKKK